MYSRAVGPPVSFRGEGLGYGFLLKVQPKPSPLALPFLECWDEGLGDETLKLHACSVSSTSRLQERMM